MQIVKRKKNKTWLIIIIILLVAVGFGVWWYLTQYSKSSDNVKTNTNDKTKITIEESKQLPIIHVVAMGDMLAHDTINVNAKTSTGYDFGKYFSNIRSSYQDADVVFCNQEGSSAGENFGITGYPSFNAPTQFSSGLQSGAGCNLINLANNHVSDKGIGAVEATIDNWTNLKPLAISGANKTADDQNKVSFTTVDNIKIGFVSFADFNNNGSTPAYSINIYHDEALVRRLVTEARVNADVVIVSMHWGVEDSDIVSSDQIVEANLLSSLGADVIIGTGPHVLQKVETIDRADGGKTIVWYSLGNMLSSQLYIKQLIGGIAGFDVTKAADGKISISNLSFTPTYMHYDWTASEAANSDLLARKNAMIYLLDSAADPLSRSYFNTNVSDQKQYVINTLGSEVTVK